MADEVVVLLPDSESAKHKKANTVQPRSFNFGNPACFLLLIVSFVGRSGLRLSCTRAE